VKTYEEAMSIMFHEIGDDKQRAFVKDKARRYKDALQEVANSPLTHRLIEVLSQSQGYTPFCECEPCMAAKTFAISAFLNGLKVGMEMERTELCEPS
jgi:hypothetical protein